MSMNVFWKSWRQVFVQSGQVMHQTVSSVLPTRDHVLGMLVENIGSYSHGSVRTCGNRSEVVNEIRHRACRLLHGSYSWLATAAANMLSLGQSTPIQHEWIEIKTNCFYYIVQIWASGDILMEQKLSSKDVDQAGFSCANKTNGSDVWTIDTHRLSLQLGDVIDWLDSEQFPPSYHWSQQNCQHFSKAFMRRF